MKEPVEHGGGDGGIGEDLTPGTDARLVVRMRADGIRSICGDSGGAIKLWDTANGILSFSDVKGPKCKSIGDTIAYGHIDFALAHLSLELLTAAP